MDLRRLKTVSGQGGRLLMATLIAVASFVGNLNFTSQAHAAIGSVTEYSIPTSGVHPWYLTTGPDNNVWYTGYSTSSKLGRITTSGAFTEYSVPVPNMALMGVVGGSDGNVWYSMKGYIAGSFVGRIVKMSTSGSILGQYNVPSGRIAYDLALGPDGNVWFNENGDQRIGKITPSGSITEYTVPSIPYGSGLIGLASGSDGNMWFTMYGNGTSNAVGKITTSGVSTLYSIPTYGAQPRSITAGPDGNMWFSELGNKKVGKITTSGTITEYSTSVGTYGIAAGPDGNLWYTGSKKIGRITPLGVVTEYSVPTLSSGFGIIAGPDNAVYYANGDANKIGRVVASMYEQTISLSSVAPIDAVESGPTYTPGAVATSGLPVTMSVDLSSTGVCTISGGIVSFQHAGTCTLNANQGGDDNYNPAPQVQQSFTVSPVEADLSVALNCPSTASINDVVNCTITVTNDGPAAADSATLTALFSNSLTGASISGGGTISGQSITWSTPSLASGASATFTFSATASTASKASVSTSILQANPDSNISNNIADAKILIS